ncbi:MAG: hypothetical protein HCTETUND1_076 [Candidatus Hodgkinia cicadicola]|nr:MAG: hypothetical protein HCTETUND1_076 [Candidatus Hodgkinia cicadicola]
MLSVVVGAFLVLGPKGEKLECFCSDMFVGCVPPSAFSLLVCCQTLLMLITLTLD